MYLFQYEDGSLSKSSEFTDENKAEVSLGILQVVDISDSNNPKDYYNNQWNNIESI